MAEGRDLQPGDNGKVVVGSDVAKSLGAVVGGNVTIRGRSFEVIGVFEKTWTARESKVAMSLADAQELLYARLPKLIQQQMHPEQVVTGITVYTQPGVEPDRLAADIEKQVPGVK